LVVQSTVHDEEVPAARPLASQHRADEHPGLADQEAAEFQHDLRTRVSPPPSGRLRSEMPAVRIEVDRGVAGEVRDAQPAADVEVLQVEIEFVDEAVGEAERLCDGLPQAVRAQALRAREEMQVHEPLPLAVQDVWHLLHVDAELGGAAAHRHPRPAELEIGIDPRGEAGRLARGLLDLAEPPQLVGGLDVQDGARRERGRPFAGLLAGSGVKATRGDACRVLRALGERGYHHYIGVPCSSLAPFFGLLEQPTPGEREAIGPAAALAGATDPAAAAEQARQARDAQRRIGRPTAERLAQQLLDQALVAG
jgi:hypothetical protein